MSPSSIPSSVRALPSPLLHLVGLLALCAGTVQAQPAEQIDAGRAVTPVELAAAEADMPKRVSAPEAAPKLPNWDQPLPITEAYPPSLEHPIQWRGNPIDIGSATEKLLALQRTAQGTHARPIDGEQASRSYQRYLKSFETDIPEQFETGLDVKKR